MLGPALLAALRKRGLRRLGSRRCSCDLLGKQSFFCLLKFGLRKIAAISQRDQFFEIRCDWHFFSEMVWAGRNNIHGHVQTGDGVLDAYYEDLRYEADPFHP